MKHIVAFLAFVMLSTICYAQKLTVESFKLVSENASATENVAKDINDTPCAILKIKTTEKGLKLGGNVVGTALTNGKEYIANVATGTKKITIVGKETYPLTVYFSEYGVTSLKSNTSYEMVLKTWKISNEVSGEIGGHEYVDLGLSVKWATCDIGATRVEELGNLFKYGETIPYDEDRPYTFTEDSWGGDFRPLTLADDVAHSKWRGSWRIPTKQEWNELISKCELIWTTKNGVQGACFVAENGNKIFFPASEFIEYDDYDENKKVTRQCIKYWANGDFGCYKVRFNINQFRGGSGIKIYPSEGLNVRAVSDLPRVQENWQNEYSVKPDGYRNGYGYVDLGLSVKWATSNIGAKKVTEPGISYCWGETVHHDGSNIRNYDEKYRFLDENDKYGKNYNGQLKQEDDIASIERKSSWRIPTKNEIKELLDKCTWTWTYNYKDSGVNGYIVTSNVDGYTDKAIFMPQTERDFSYYWSGTQSTRKDDNNELTLASTICFNEFHYHMYDYKRCFPLFIRPVCK